MISSSISLDMSLEGFEDKCQDNIMLREDRRESKRNMNRRERVRMSNEGKNLSADGLDYYEEIDERMSRNSYEYPEEQAKYVGRWIDENPLGKSEHNEVSSSSSISGSISSLFDEDWRGNVIGIRGYPDATNKDNQSRMDKSSFNRLRFDNERLLSKLNRLRSYFDRTVQKFRKVISRKNNEISLLKGILNSNSNNNIRINEQSNKDNLNVKSYEDRLKGVIEKLEMKLKEKDISSIEMFEEFKVEMNKQRAALESEYKEAKDKLIKLENEPSNKLLSVLSKENERLKIQLKLDSNEFKNLINRYDELEMRLRDIMNENKGMNIEKNDEMSKLRLELCRYQVYQPKLESILENEREVKCELQKRLVLIENEKLKLIEERDNLKNELSNIKIKLINKQDSLKEYELLRSELIRWQNKYQLLKEEKDNYELNNKNLKIKLDHNDQKFLLDKENTNENCNIQLERLNHQLIKVEKERNKLKCDIDFKEKENESLKFDNENLEKKIHELIRELELSQMSNNNNNNKDNIKLINETNYCYKNDITFKQVREFKETEIRCRQLSDEKRILRIEIEKLKREIDNLKQRLNLQLKSYDELKERKEKEMTSLKVNLNFEHYQKQIALENIEKELKACFRELEALKVRFGSKRGSQMSLGNVRITSNNNKTKNGQFMLVTSSSNTNTNTNSSTATLTGSATTTTTTATAMNLKSINNNNDNNNNNNEDDSSNNNNKKKRMSNNRNDLNSNLKVSHTKSSNKILKGVSMSSNNRQHQVIGQRQVHFNGSTVEKRNEKENEIDTEIDIDTDTEIDTETDTMNGNGNGK